MSEQNTEIENAFDHGKDGETAFNVEQLVEAVKVLHDLLHKTQVAFVPTTDEAFKLNYEALVKYEWMIKD